jgi:uncharacterized repeat protein (TIGR01451 family)
MYSFLLSGDPAMQMMRPSLSITKDTETEEASPGDQVDFILEVSNYGIYPSHVIVSDTLPQGMSFITATSSIGYNLNTSGNDLLFDLQFGIEEHNKGIPRNGSAVFTLTAQINSPVAGGLFTNVASVDGTGLEILAGDEIDTASFFVWNKILLPQLTN